MSAVALVTAAVALQLAAGVVRVRGWFHCVRASVPPGATVRFRDVVIAHLGSSGWNGVLPAHGGEGVKVALLRRRLRSTPLSTLAGTLVPTSLVEGVFTLILASALLVAGVLSPTAITGRLPSDIRAPVLLAVTAGALVTLLALRRRVPRLIREIRAGLAVLRRPGVLFTRVIPWQLASRVMRLASFALILAAAGFALAPGPVLLLMAVQGATPSVGPASAAVRIAIVAAAFPAQHGAVDTAHAAQVVIAATLASSAINLAISTIVLAAIVRTASPHRIVSHLRAACGREPGTDGSANRDAARPAIAASSLPGVPSTQVETAGRP